MAESLENTLKKGLVLYSKNLLLAVPFVLNTVFSFFFLALLLASPFALFSIPISADAEALTSSFQKVEGMLPAIILTFLALLVVYFLVSMFVSSFFSAGAIGMAKAAAETGKTTMSDMFTYGSKSVLSLFAANLLFLLAVLVFVGMFIAAVFVLAMAEQQLDTGLIQPFINLFSRMMGLMILILSIVFTVIPYAIVVGGTGPIEGIKRGYAFLKENKLSYALLWLFTKSLGEYALLAAFLMSLAAASFMVLPFALSAETLGDMIPLGSLDAPLEIIAMLIQALATFIWALVLMFFILILLSVLLLEPLTTLWWSMMYIDRGKMR